MLHILLNGSTLEFSQVEEKRLGSMPTWARTVLTLQTFKCVITTRSILLILAIMKRNSIEKSGHSSSSGYFWCPVSITVDHLILASSQNKPAPSAEIIFGHHWEEAQPLLESFLQWSRSSQHESLVPGLRLKDHISREYHNHLHALLVDDSYSDPSTPHSESFYLLQREATTQGCWAQGLHTQ